LASEPFFVQTRDASTADYLYFSFVTLTTVGYGDIVPETEKGRLAGVFLMLTGVATLGVLSGTLASAFRSSSRASAAEDGADAASDEAAVDEAPATDQPTANGAATTDDLQAQLADLRAHLVVLEEHVATLVERSSPSPPG
jgi:voltage-gated potassium channel